MTASAAMGWLSLLPFVPLLRIHIANAPTAWIPRPRLHELLGTGQPQINVVLLAGVVVGYILTAGRNPTPPGGATLTAQLSEDSTIEACSRHFLFVLAVAFLTVPFAFWLLAQLGPNLSLPRYSLPMMLGWTALLALGLHAVALPVANTLWRRASLGVGVGALMAYAPVDAMLKPLPISKPCSPTRRSKA